MLVTIHRVLRSSWCPLAVTRAPGTRPATDTLGASQKLRCPIRNQRPNESQVTIVPRIEKRRGSGSGGDGDDVGVWQDLHTPPRVRERCVVQVAYRSQMPRGPDVRNVYPTTPWKAPISLRQNGVLELVVAAAQAPRRRFTGGVRRVSRPPSSA